MRTDLVAVRLRDLRIAEEFETACSHERGLVVDWGYILDEDRTGRRSRVRAVKVRIAGLDRILHAEVKVLVPFDRPHWRPENDEARWSSPLEGTTSGEPFNAPRVAC